MKLSSASRKPLKRVSGILAEGVAQLVRYRPGRLVGDAQLTLQKLGRDPALVAAQQIGGEEPFRQVRLRPVEHGP